MGEERVKTPRGIPVSVQRWLVLIMIGAIVMMCYGCSAGCASLMYHLHYKQMIEKDQIERSIRIEEKLDALIKK